MGEAVRGCCFLFSPFFPSFFSSSILFKAKQALLLLLNLILSNIARILGQVGH